jgi:hypothetical protein
MLSLFDTTTYKKIKKGFCKIEITMMIDFNK